MKQQLLFIYQKWGQTQRTSLLKSSGLTNFLLTNPNLEPLGAHPSIQRQNNPNNPNLEPFGAHPSIQRQSNPNNPNLEPLGAHPSNQRQNSPNFLPPFMPQYPNSMRRY